MTIRIPIDPETGASNGKALIRFNPNLALAALAFQPVEQALCFTFGQTGGPFHGAVQGVMYCCQTSGRIDPIALKCLAWGLDNPGIDSFSASANMSTFVAWLF